MQVQIAEKAAECVTRSITALGRQGNDSLVRLVLADEQVCGDLLGSLSGLKQRESQNPALRVEALTRVAAAVSLLRFRQGIVICTPVWMQSCVQQSKQLGAPCSTSQASKHNGGCEQCTGLHSMHACMHANSLIMERVICWGVAVVEIKESEKVKPFGVITGWSVPKAVRVKL